MGYIGFRMGLGTELVKLLGLTGGFWVGFRYYQAWGDVLAQHTFLGLEWAAAFVLTLLVVGMYLAVTRILGFFGNLVKVNFHERLSQIGGGLAGLLRGALIASVILVVFQQLPSPYLQASIEEHSLTGAKISRMAPAVYDGLCAVPKQLQKAVTE